MEQNNKPVRANGYYWVTLHGQRVIVEYWYHEGNGTDHWYHIGTALSIPGYKVSNINEKRIVEDGTE